jgi:hypothetical protein
MILKGLDLLSAEIIPVGELITKLKEIFSLNPSVQVNLQYLGSDAIMADRDTLLMVAKWQSDHGLPVTVQPPPDSAT